MPYSLIQGKWLHACLHQNEGDLESNAKLWYEQVSPSILKLYWGEEGEDPVKAAVSNMKAIGAVRQLAKPSKDEQAEIERVSKIRWRELVCIFEDLETKYGYKEWNGTDAYTKDQDPSHKSM